MANRHLSRSIVLQTLFEWDFQGRQNETIPDILARNTAEFAPGLNDTAFMQALLSDVLGKREELDLIIEKAAPAWPIDRIAVVDRNVLRIGLAELLFSDRSDVPPKVAINEAIELAKSFGGDGSGRFVNGVLGAVYKELGEPGKDEKSPRNGRGAIDPETLPLERLVGAVVYAKHEGDLYLALVHDVFGRWTLSKGKIAPDETEEAGAIRKVQEEIGVTTTIREKIGENEYIASHPEKGKLRKRVSYFLSESPFVSLELEVGNGGLDDARWFRATDVADLTMYDDIIPIITKGISLLLEKGY